MNSWVLWVQSKITFCVLELLGKKEKSETASRENAKSPKFGSTLHRHICEACQLCGWRRPESKEQ